MKKAALFALSALAILSLILSSCGGNPEVCITVGSIDVSREEFFEYANCLKILIENRTSMSYSDLLDLKDQAVGGESIQKQLERYAVDDIVGDKHTILMFDDFGLIWGDEQDRRLQALYENTAAKYESEEAMSAALAESGLSPELFREQLALGIKYSMIKSFLFDAGGLRQITDEDLMAYYLANYYRGKHILVRTSYTDENGDTLPLSDEEVAAKHELFSRIVSDIESRVVSFDDAMVQYSEDPGLKNNPGGYIFMEDALYIAEFKDAVMSLDIGKTAVIETPLGYHLVKRESLRIEDFSPYSDSIYETVLESRISELKAEFSEKYPPKLNQSVIDEVISILE